VTTDEPGSGPAPRRKFKPRRASLENGETLVLNGDGSIEHRDRDGLPNRRWTPDDPDWSRQAIRFGLYESPSTARPSGRNVPASKPPR
jgi:hypothetical protein